MKEEKDMLEQETIFPISVGSFSLPHGSTGPVELTKEDWAVAVFPKVGRGLFKDHWVRSWAVTDLVELPLVCRVMLVVQDPKDAHPSTAVLGAWHRFELDYVLEEDGCRWVCSSVKEMPSAAKQLEEKGYALIPATPTAPLPTYDPKEFPNANPALRQKYAKKLVREDYYGTVNIGGQSKEKATTDLGRVLVQEIKKHRCDSPLMGVLSMAVDFIGDDTLDSFLDEGAMTVNSQPPPTPPSLAEIVQTANGIEAKVIQGQTLSFDYLAVSRSEAPLPGPGPMPPLYRDVPPNNEVAKHAGAWVFHAPESLKFQCLHRGDDGVRCDTPVTKEGVFHPYCSAHYEEHTQEWDFCAEHYCERWAQRTADIGESRCSLHGGYDYLYGSMVDVPTGPCPEDAPHHCHHEGCGEELSDVPFCHVHASAHNNEWRYCKHHNGQNSCLRWVPMNSRFQTCFIHGGEDYLRGDRRTIIMNPQVETKLVAPTPKEPVTYLQTMISVFCAACGGALRVEELPCDVHCQCGVVWKVKGTVEVVIQTNGTKEKIQLEWTEAEPRFFQ